jgi:hypothetical protein
MRKECPNRYAEGGKKFHHSFSLLRSNGFLRAQRSCLAGGMNPEYQAYQGTKHE